MPEWSIGAVSKTVERFAFQGFESLSLRSFDNAVCYDGIVFYICKSFLSLHKI